MTLKAADAPPAVPSATVPVAPTVRPPTPGGPPTPTAAAGAPRPPAPAPTIPLRTAGAPTAASPAPTIRLATSAAPIGAGTGALTPGGSPSLPKATVQLSAPTQPLGTSFPTASQAATLQMEDDEDESANEGVVNILAGVGFAAALAVLAFQLMLAGQWISAEDNPNSGDWSQLIQ